MVQPDVEWDERLFDSIKTALRSIKDGKRNVDSRGDLIYNVSKKVHYEKKETRKGQKKV